MTLNFDFQGQILKSGIKGIETRGMWIDRKWGEIVAFNFDLSHDIDLEFQGQFVKKLYLYFRNRRVD